MNSMLKLAYDLGVLQARHIFEEKVAANQNDVVTSLLGALPMLGPSLAGQSASQDTPFEPKEVAARTSAKASLGQGVGGLGGAALGAGVGAAGTALYNKFRDKGLWDKMTGSGDADVGRNTGIGAMLGSALGSAAGGAYGAHKGKQEATNVAAGEQLEDLMNDRQEEIARQQRNQRILQAITRAHSMGGYGLPLKLQIPPQLAEALQRSQQGQ